MRFILPLSAVITVAMAVHCAHPSTSRPPTQTTTPTPTTPQPAPTTWPEGTYALPMTDSGCDTTEWKTGSFYHDTEDHANANAWNTTHFGGFTKPDGYLRSFCVRDIATEGAYSWPAGSYCILRKHVCPGGFQEGSILWDDENTFNTNQLVDAEEDLSNLPDGVFSDDTELIYCCREDGNASMKIALPVTSPFYLLMKESKCQEVADMTVIKEMIIYDDEDSSNHNSRSGSTPMNTGSSYNHGLMYCYYEQIVEP